MSQPKVEAIHNVDYWVSGPQCCKDVTHGLEVLLQTVIMNGLSFGGDKSCTHPINKYLEERYWVLYSLEVWRDTHPGE